MKKYYCHIHKQVLFRTVKKKIEDCDAYPDDEPRYEEVIERIKCRMCEHFEREIFNFLEEKRVERMEPLNAFNSTGNFGWGYYGAFGLTTLK